MIIKSKFLTLCLSSLYFIISMTLSYADPKNEIKYTYWENGKPKQAQYCDSQGNIRGTKFYRNDGSLEQLITYDIDGNITEESYYDTDGTLRTNPVDTWAAKISTYEDGKIREISYYDEDAHLTERDFFDKSGNFMDRKFIGDARLANVKDFKPDLEQFSCAEEEIESRTRVGVEEDEFYDKKGNLEDNTVTAE